MFYRSLGFAGLLVVTSSAHALDITVDSDLVDWLAGAPTGSASDWTPADASVKWMVEDQTGGNGVYLNPGYGGQAYDAEAIYVHRSATHINVAVVTGRAPGAGGWAAGDIAIDFGLDGSFDYGLVTLTDATGIGSAGELYEISDWNYGLWTAPAVTGDPETTAFGLSHPTTVAAGTKVGNAALSYDAFKYDGATGLDLGEFGDAGKHYVIEAAIELSLIDENLRGESFLVHWTMACANDYVEVDPPGGSVPTPAPLLLMLSGLAAIGGRRLYRAVA